MRRKLIPVRKVHLVHFSERQLFTSTVRTDAEHPMLGLLVLLLQKNIWGHNGMWTCLLTLFCHFLFSLFLMDRERKAWRKNGPAVGDIFKAAIIKVRACLPFNHTMSEKQKSTSAVVLFSFLTRSLKLKDIPVIQGEPLMHIHKGHYLEEECQNLPEGACFVFSRISVYMCVAVMTLFEVECTQNKNCLCIRICENPFLSCTNEFCIHWMQLSTIPPWFIILPVVFTRTMGRQYVASFPEFIVPWPSEEDRAVRYQCPQTLAMLVCVWKSYGIGWFCSFICSNLVCVTTSPDLPRDPSFSVFALGRFSRSTESFSVNLDLNTILKKSKMTIFIF